MKDASSAPVIVICEDEWLIREEMCQEFRQADWNVLEARTGEGCVALAQSGVRINALVTDIQLPGQLSGWDVAEIFRAADPDILVIYASGNSIEKSRMVFGSVFLSKPCNAAELLEVCRKLHNGAQSR